MLFRQKVHGGCAVIVHMVVVLSLVKGRNALFLGYPGLVPIKIIMMLLFVGVLFINSY